jgi:peptidoglycan/LPS O-acetylase OafA/YrhL
VTVTQGALPSADRILSSGDESGTAPGDRTFRPDVEGLRAVAVLLVVLYHAGFPGLSGGYVGVDVFFVISGFVITGVLLRERVASKGNSILAFYGRRCRRIIPAATAVIIATVILSYLFLGVITGNQTAVDARWTSVFLANFHFSSEGTNYLAAQQPPSPLQNFWSLAVEEQFYLVYPTLFILVAALRTRLSLQVRLAAALTAVIIVSFLLSVIQTGSQPTVAYFSPFTRAWELALGALVAVGTPWLLRVPRLVSSLMTWIGLAAIGYSALAFTNLTPYPGSHAAIPVCGTALVIAGGVTAPQWAAESLLKLPPFPWLGRLSYSIYLWHWPILIIAAEAAGQSSLPFHQNIVWLAVSLGAAATTYYLIENPVRHANLTKRSQWAPIGLGVVLIATSVGVATVGLNGHAASASTAGAAAPVTFPKGTNPSTVVSDLVHAAPQIRALPSHLTPTLAGVKGDWGGPKGPCWPALGQSVVPACVFGDPHGSHTMVIYGDSHAAMWFDTLDVIASLEGWKLLYLGKGDCPADDLHYGNPPDWGTPGGEYYPCDQFHALAISRIRRLKPDLVIITQEVRTNPKGAFYSAAQWQQGLLGTFKQMGLPSSHVVVLGNVPILPYALPQCLVQHSSDIQACSGPPNYYIRTHNQAEEAAAAEAGVQYINTIPWFCSTTCTAVVGNLQVFWDQFHINATYADFLGAVLAEDLNFPGRT